MPNLHNPHCVSFFYGFTHPKRLVKAFIEKLAASVVMPLFISIT